MKSFHKIFKITLKMFWVLQSQHRKLAVINIIFPVEFNEQINDIFTYTVNSISHVAEIALIKLFKKFKQLQN